MNEKVVKTITIALTEKDIENINIILDPHNEAQPDNRDITAWIYGLIQNAIENSPGRY